MHSNSSRSAPVRLARGGRKFRFHRWIGRVLGVAACWAAGIMAAPPASGGTLTFTVEDADRGAVPCNVFLKDVNGKPVRPPGLPFWHDHFACPGRTKIELPAGHYSYEIERGAEYRRLAGAVDVPGAGGVRAALVLPRLADMAAEGWYSGDLHIHRPVADMPLLMRAADLNFAPVITWWNHRGTWASHFPRGETAHSAGPKRFYDAGAGEDEREGGALLYFGLSRPLPLEKASREYPSPLHFAEEAHAQPHTWIDIEKPFWWDVPVWLASGKMDSIELANNHMDRSRMYEGEAWGKPRDGNRFPPPRGNGFWSQEIYYHVLNSGLRVPPTAGSISGVLPNPVGYNRVYAHLDGPLTPEHWWQAVKAGRSFVTNGPLLRVTAGGRFPGHVFTAPRGGHLTLDLTIRLASNDPIRSLEIIRNGEVLRTIAVDYDARTGQCTPTQTSGVDFDSSGWFLLRAIVDNPVTFRFASTGPFYVEMGDSPRRISRQSVTFFRNWVGERIARIKATVRDRAEQSEILRDQERARAFWQNRLAQANAP